MAERTIDQKIQNVLKNLLIPIRIIEVSHPKPPIYFMIL